MRTLLFGIFLVLFSVSAHAAGFEKSQSWSAKAAAQASAVVGSVTGAEALYFNPAGLVQSSTRGEISVNFSPTFSQFSGANPYSPAGSVSGSSTFSPIMGIVASYRPKRKFGVGIGYYVSGGSHAKFEDLNYAGSAPLSTNFDSLRPTIETNIALTEAALGGGYEVAPGFRIGAAWRVLMVNAKFSTVSLSSNSALGEITVDNIKAKKWDAFKLGAQYEEPAHRWGLGIDFRSSVSFTATSDTSGQVETSGGGSTVGSLGTPGTAELENTFPYELAFGGWTRASDLLRLAYQYSFTNYAKNEELVIRGSVGATPLKNIPQYWKNMHTVRLGGEYTRMSFPIRFGYAYTSQVTPSDYARSTFASPGPGHSVTLGTGIILNRSIDVDGAVEYSFASGTARNVNTSTTAPGVAEVASDSKFSSHAYVAHLSAKYRF